MDTVKGVVADYIKYVMNMDVSNSELMDVSQDVEHFIVEEFKRDIEEMVQAYYDSQYR